MVSENTGADASSTSAGPESLPLRSLSISITFFFFSGCAHTLGVHHALHVCLHTQSQKQVRRNLGRLCFRIEVSMSQQDWILPWSLTLHKALFPSAVCLDKGPPVLLSTGPQALTAEIQAGVIIWTGEAVHVHRSPFPQFLCSLTYQLSSPQLSHATPGPVSVFEKLQRRYICFCWIHSRHLHWDSLYELWMQENCSVSKMGFLWKPQNSLLSLILNFNLISKTKNDLCHSSEKGSVSTCGARSETKSKNAEKTCSYSKTKQ